MVCTAEDSKTSRACSRRSVHGREDAIGTGRRWLPCRCGRGLSL